jgi:predicted ATP-dependent endonuclease of OLD family
LDYLRKRPNFDILKLLFAERVILVEGPTEEMLINTVINKKYDSLNNIEIISIGQKGYRTFLDIWLQLNMENQNKKIAVVRDYDNQPKAKKDHDSYDDKYKNIMVRTTKEYTLEDDLVRAGDNCQVLAILFGVNNDFESVSKKLNDDKAEGMLAVCDAMLLEKDPIEIVLPPHICEVIKALSC